MTGKLTAVVTGSNRGIGKAIVEKLASVHHHTPLSIYATSRSGQDLNISTQHDNEIHYAKLDISDASSITTFLQEPALKDTSINILVNNAGVNLDYNDDSLDAASKAKETININYEGTKRVCLAFLDSKGGRMSLNANARIVNVSSAAASLHGYSKALQERFRAVETLSDVDELAKDYIDAISVSSAQAEQRGWRKPSYSVSKALMNAFTIVLAKASGNENVLINCCDPGWVASDMGRLVGSPQKTEEEGARIPVKLALADLQGSSGKFWGNRDVNSSADGEILLW